MILLEVDGPAILLLDTFLSMLTDAKLSGLPSSGQDCFASSELSGLVLSKILQVPVSSSVDKALALPWPQVDDAVFLFAMVDEQGSRNT